MMTNISISIFYANNEQYCIAEDGRRHNIADFNLLHEINSNVVVIVFMFTYVWTTV